MGSRGKAPRLLSTPPEGATDHDVAIVGAGAAGLACARRLRARGIGHVLLEAGATIGGRARTTHPDLLGGALLDEGASWLHAPDHNPLVPLARAAGITLRDAWSDRHHVLFDGDRRATEAAHRERDAAERDYDRLLTARAADRAAPDVSVADAGEPFRRLNRWGATLETWEASIIAAADAPALSLRDCRDNALPGGDLAVPIGVGTLVARLLAPEPPTVLWRDTEVHAIDRTAADHVRVDTARGSLRARSVIVTVSTGVLRAGAIRFTPPLPDAHADAIRRLPMGLLGKIALRLADEQTGETFDIPAGGSGLVERRVERPGDGFILFHVRPNGADHVLGFFGGEAAWAVAHDAVAADAWARTELARLFGAAAVARALRPGAHATTWGIDPLFGGAYAYVGPGDVPARAALAVPIDDGRLLFCGEACRTDGIAGTVGGAASDGIRAADAVAAA